MTPSEIAKPNSASVQTSRAAATSHLALAAWSLGDVAGARELIDEARARAIELAHAPTLVNIHCYLAMLEILRDAEAARRDAEACLTLIREHGSRILSELRLPKS